MVMMHETEVEAHSILLVYFSMGKIPSLNRNVLVRRDKAYSTQKNGLAVSPQLGSFNMKDVPPTVGFWQSSYRSIKNIARSQKMRHFLSCGPSAMQRQSIKYCSLMHQVFPPTRALKSARSNSRRTNLIQI
jgi:hypothetical protein